MDHVLNILKKGPLTGKELVDKSGLDALYLWRICQSTPSILCKRIGKRFLRLDKSVEGYARLSPSIKREFLTYTVIGLKKSAASIDKRKKSLSEHIASVSNEKSGLALETAREIMGSFTRNNDLKNGVCFILAGDIVHGMAHREPRPEVSTGELVNGSDLDLIVVTSDVPEKARKLLDDAIYAKKYHMLRNSTFREEIDYIIKDISTVKKQSLFDRFESMVACKILDEGKFLYGNRDIFSRVKELMRKAGVPKKLAALKRRAAKNHDEAESTLLSGDAQLLKDRHLYLFYTKEESDEIF